MLRNHSLMSSVCFASDDALGFSMDDEPTNNKPAFMPTAIWDALKPEQQAKVLKAPRKAYDRLVEQKKIDPAKVPFDVAAPSEGSQGEPDAVTTDENTAATDEGRENYKFALALANSVAPDFDKHLKESAARGVDEMIDPVRLSFDIRKSWGDNVSRLPWPGSKKSNLPAGSNELADEFPIKIKRDGKWTEETVSTYALMFDRSPTGKALADEITRYDDTANSREMPDERKVKMPREQLDSFLNQMRSMRTRSINKLKYAAKFVIQQNRITNMPKVNWEFIAEIDPATEKVVTFDDGTPKVIGNKEMIALWSTSNLSIRERCSVKKFMGFDVAKALKMPNGGTLAELKSTYTTGKAARGTKVTTGTSGTPVKINIETVAQFHDYAVALLGFLMDPKRYEMLISELATKAPEATEELVLVLGDLSPRFDAAATKVEPRYKVANAKRLEESQKQQQQKSAA